ncbi:transcriptional regulator [Nocardia suismassiliense]|uniref:transcriptional regulator n=1 Tax=Nocardia suismassiliense TaxID=2077092 RepID=UPI000D1DF797|nr:transcriptional regulator [Nocardia suismassiliense]
MTAVPPPTRQQWLEVRKYLRENRFELTAHAAAEFPGLLKVAGTPLLTRRGWIPSTPLPLDQVTIDLTPTAHRHFDDLEAAAQMGLPTHEDGSPFSSYADTMSSLARPAVFADRTTYRLADADLTGPAPHLRFEIGSYFDSVNFGEAAAHEFAATHRGSPTGSRLRSAIADPCDLTRRRANMAISTLTIVHNVREGHAKLLLHWRDPAKVGHAGGMFQVLPVGIFQPSGEQLWNRDNDFSLWKNILRELAEELGGHTEDYGSENAPIDYQRWEFASRLDQGLLDGHVQALCLGLGVDPLSFATDLLTAIVIDSELFEDLFGAVGGDNDEGQILDAKPFTTTSLEHLVTDYHLQAAGAATLRLAEKIQLPAVQL